MKGILSLFVLIGLSPLAVNSFAVECGLAGGVIGFGGLGAQAHCQQEGSHWRMGMEYARVPDYTFRDPFTGRPLTIEKEYFIGPFVHYQFTPGAEGRWYAGVSYLKWTRSEKSLVFGDRSVTSTTDPYIGGGYMKRFGKRGFYNLAVFIAPWAKLKTDTSTSSTENEGASDIHLNIGIFFR